MLVRIPGQLTTLELIRAVAEAATVGIVVTNTAVDRLGPVILYANEAFSRITGRDLNDIVGQNPRFMQGKETRRATLDTFHRALVVGERFHGYLTNYRADGSKYRVEIDCRPLRAADERIENFVAFEREVVRRIGRPGGTTGRYEPADKSHDLFTGPLRTLNLFEHV